MTVKKTKGIKRHIVTDIMGNILAVYIHKANIHDTKGGIFVMEKALHNYPSINACCSDAGYRGIFKNTFEMYYGIHVDISKQINPKFEIHPKRWRVENNLRLVWILQKIFKRFLVFRFFRREFYIYISHSHLLLNRL